MPFGANAPVREEHDRSSLEEDLERPPIILSFFLTKFQKRVKTGLTFVRKLGVRMPFGASVPVT